MHNRSSTSSSEGSWRAIGLAVILGALCIAVGSVVAVPMMLSDRNDEIAQRFHLLTKSRIRVVFMGSSLFHAGIDTPTFEEAWHMKPGAALNLAGPSMGVWEAQALVGGQAGNTLLVMDLDPWELNDEQWHPILHQPCKPEALFYRWATWNQRSHVRGEGMTALAMTAFPILRMRRPLADWIRWARWLHQPWPDAIPRPRYHTDPKSLARRRKTEAFFPEVISEWHLKNYQHSAPNLARLQEFLDAAASRQVSVVLVYPPLHPTYYASIRQDPVRWAEFQRSRAALESLDVEWVWFDTPTQAGLTSDDYMDYGHLTSEGSKKFSATLARTLADRGLAPR